jgi:hypothetical protein
MWHTIVDEGEEMKCLGRGVLCGFEHQRFSVKHVIFWDLTYKVGMMSLVMDRMK